MVTLPPMVAVPAWESAVLVCGAIVPVREGMMPICTDIVPVCKRLVPVRERIGNGGMFIEPVEADVFAQDTDGAVVPRSVLWEVRLDVEFDGNTDLVSGVSIASIALIAYPLRSAFGRNSYRLAAAHKC